MYSNNYQVKKSGYNFITMTVLIIISFLFISIDGYTQGTNNVILSENFEDSALDNRISIETIGTFNDEPGIKSVTNFNSTRAYGFGRSTCGANCFDNYVVKFIISFSQPTYVSHFSFKEMELYGGWGSKGHILIDDIDTDSTFGGDLGNAGIADKTFEEHIIPVGREITKITLMVRDITSQSEIFIDDIEVFVNQAGDLIAYYPFNGNANDESGNGNHGTVYNATLTADRFSNPNSAYTFDGKGTTYINIGNNVKPLFPLTISIWVNLNNLDETVEVFRNDLTDGNSYYHGASVQVTTGGKLQGFVGSGYASPSSRKAKRTTGYVVSAQKWQFLTIIFNDYNDMNLFVDGIEYEGEYSGSGTGMTYSSRDGTIGIGKPDGTRAVEGKLDEVRIYNRALSEAAIMELFHENGWMGYQAIVAYYPFNGNANDESGNGYHGVNTGVELVPDRFGNENSAYYFNEIGDNIDINSTAVSNLDFPCTITLWAKIEDITAGGDFFTTNDYQVGNKYSGIEFKLGFSGELMLRYGDNSGNTASDRSIFVTENLFINSNEWVFIAAVMEDENTCTLYKNTNSEQPARNGTASLVSDGSNAKVHSIPKYNSFFQGIVDDIKLYNYSLSESEIMNLYCEGDWCDQMTQFQATLDPLEIGPKPDDIKVPDNGLGYVYFSFKKTDGSLINTTLKDFPVKLKSVIPQEVTVMGYIYSAGILRLSINPSLFGESNSIILSTPDSITIGNAKYNIESDPIIFSGLKIPVEFNRNWDIFAGGSAGVSKKFGGNIAAAKLSIKGEGGVGLNFNIDETGHLAIGRRLELGIGIKAEVPSIELPKAAQNMDLTLLEMEASVRGLVGQEFNFNGSGLNGDEVKMAQTGFMLETMSLGGIALSPITGFLIKAIMNTINSLSKVDAYFDRAYVKRYWGLGVEGSVNTGFGINFDKLNLSALDASVSFTMQGVSSTYYRDLEPNKVKVNNYPQIMAKSIEIRQASEINLSLFDIGLKYNDNVTLSSGNFGILDVGLGMEVFYRADRDANDYIRRLYAGVSGGGDIAVFNNRFSYFNTTIFDFPEQYFPIIQESHTGLSGMVGGNKPIGIGANAMEKDINKIVSLIGENYMSHPIKVYTIEAKGNGFELNFQKSVSDYMDLPYDLSIGFLATYYDQIEYTKKTTEIYREGYNYVLTSCDYNDQMREKEFKEITGELLEGTMPLIETAFKNLLESVKKFVVSGVEYTIDVIKSTKEKVASIVGSVQKRGEWIVTVFNPRSPRILHKKFGVPEVKNLYYSNNVFRKTGYPSIKESLVKAESKLVLVSDAINFSFIPDGDVEDLDSLEIPVTIKLTIYKEMLSENGFSNNDKSKIHVYSYLDSAVGWVLEGGERNVDTLSVNIQKLGTYSLGIEINNMTDDITPPEIYEFGPMEGNTYPDYPEIYANIKDERFGSGLDLGNTYIVINSDTVDLLYNPAQEKVFYQLSDKDSLNLSNISVNIFVSDHAGNSNEISFSFKLNISNIANNYNVPESFQVMQNYPNPFNNETAININIPNTGQVEVNIFDAQGRYIKNLMNKSLSRGSYSIRWDGKNNLGYIISSGTYFYQIKYEDFNIVKKMQLIK